MSHIVIHNWGALGTSLINSPYPYNDTHYIVSPTSIRPPITPTPSPPFDLSLRSEATDDDYNQAANLIQTLRSTHGNLPLTPHSALELTTCPGTWDLSRLDALSRNNYSAFRKIIHRPTNPHPQQVYRLEPNTPLTPNLSTAPHTLTPAIQHPTKPSTDTHVPVLIPDSSDYYLVPKDHLIPLNPQPPHPAPDTPPEHHTTPFPYDLFRSTSNPPPHNKGALVFLPDHDRPLAPTSSTAAHLATIADRHSLDFVLASADYTPEHIRDATLHAQPTPQNLIFAGTGSGATTITQHLARTFIDPFYRINTTFIIHGPHSRSMPHPPDFAHKWRINAIMVFATNNVHETSKHLFDALGHPTRYLNTLSFTQAVEQTLNMKGVIR